MKKLNAAVFTAVFTLLTVFGCVEPANAGVLFADIDAPLITSLSGTPSAGNSTVKLNVSCCESAVEAEKLRSLVYAAFLKEHPAQDISDTDSAWAKSCFTVHFQVSADGKVWAEMPRQCNIAAAAVYSFDVTDDALRALSDRSSLPSAEGGTVLLRLRAYIAASDCTAGSGDNRVLSGFSEILTFSLQNIHTVKYVLSGGINSTANPPAFFTTDKSIALASPSRAGYIFKGWYTPDGKNVGSIPASCKDNVTYEAKWEAKRYSVYYVLSQPVFSHDFSRAVNKLNPVSVYAGETAVLNDIKSPVSGYIFGGWYETADFSSAALKELSGVTHDITLYAEWITYDEKARRDESFRKTAALLGDADNDGRVSSADARLVLRHSVKLEKINAAYLDRVDFFGTGVISSACARTVLRLSVGLDDAYDIMAVFGIKSLT